MKRINFLSWTIELKENKEQEAIYLKYWS